MLTWRSCLKWTSIPVKNRRQRHNSINANNERKERRKNHWNLQNLNLYTFCNGLLGSKALHLAENRQRFGHTIPRIPNGFLEYWDLTCRASCHHTIKGIYTFAITCSLEIRSHQRDRHQSRFIAGFQSWSQWLVGDLGRRQCRNSLAMKTIGFVQEWDVGSRLTTILSVCIYIYMYVWLCMYMYGNR